MADFTATIDLSSLSSSTGATINGTAGGNLTGYSVSYAGDINGDGIADIIIGAPGADDNGTDSGLTYVVYGQSGGFGGPIDLASLDGSNGFVIYGIDDLTSSGFSVSGIGDVNKDGIDDFAVTEPVAASGSGNNGGYTYVVYGNDSGFPKDFSYLDLGTGDGFRLIDSVLDDVSDLTVSGAGDVNGDGIDDFIIGAPTFDVDGKADKGVSYVVFGNGGGFSFDFDLSSLNGSNGFRLDGVAGGDETGASVSSAGDINGDGKADLIIGAPSADPGGTVEGAAYVVFGASSYSADMDLSSLNGTNGFMIEGAGATDLAGMSVSSAGDFNGDGYDDLIIGAPGDTASGTAYIIFGKASGYSASYDLAALTASEGLRLDGIGSGDLAGVSVSTAGDLNGDGFDDVVVGGTEADPNGLGNEGAAYVVFGSSGYGSTLSLDLSTLNGTNGFRLDGVAAGDLSGSSVSTAGDVNDDGFDDLIVGGSNANGGAGAAYVVYGRAPTTAVTRSGGNADQVIRGGAFGDTLNGLNGADTLYGDGGNDSLNGGNHDDVLYGGDNDDTLDGSYGSDSLFGGAGNDSLDGGAGSTGNDTIFGGSGNDTLRGQGGTNLLQGGTGNDVYRASINDTIIEAAGAGIDTLEAYANGMTLADNVEYMVFYNSGAVLSGTGSSGDDHITGNQFDNIIDGGAGADTMVGGLGNDTYVVDNAGDVVTEGVGEGTDTVQASFDYTLGANVEGLELTGTANLSGTGNSADNTLVGNSGNNTLDGGVGADTMTGGEGDDTYYVDNAGDVADENFNEGTDTILSTITIALGSNSYIENVTLLGTANIDATGDNASNLITGNSGDNVLSGGSGGTDTLVGGDGNDTYIAGGSDVVTEGIGGGDDTVQSVYGYVLSANVEHLIQTGTNTSTLVGNASDNSITGNAAANTLDGGAGVDTLIGGDGDDTYIVDNTSDVVTENAAEGTDTVQASASYTLSANVEDLELTGTADIDGTGNGEANTITGNSGANTLSGAGGGDTLYGGEGNDSLNGGSGVDSLYGQGGNDTLNGGTGADNMQGGTGDDTYIVDDAGDQIGELTGEGDDTVEASVTFSIEIDLHVENLTLTGTGNIDATGNNNANTLTGNSGNNNLDAGSSDDTLVGNGGNDTLDGGAGADSMVGGTGDDVYVVDNTNDVVVELAGQGDDTVQSTATYTLSANVEDLELIGTFSVDATGNSLDNVLTGNSGNNVLDGDTGADTMAGGDGNDTYVVNSLDDVITENANEGYDTVIINRSFTLGANFERLQLTGTADLTGTGNSANNVLFGNSGNNTLDGGAGSDGYYGGAGDDVYYVDSATESIYEYAGEGTDTVISSATLFLTSMDYVENLTLTGSGDFNGTGNTEDNLITGNIGNNDLRGDDGNDTLIGGDGDDTLLGQAGADSMVGGDGNDTYTVDDAGDTVTENANEGYDYVTTSVSFTLSENIEALYLLTGTSNIDGTGNSGDNYIAGNTGNNRLDGGAGADTLSGRDGDDVYVIDNVNDSIEGEYSGNDTIEASISFSLDTISSVENLTLIGTADIDGDGSVVANVIIGNSGANHLTGAEGADTISGNGGADTLQGDDGADELDGGNGNDELEGGADNDTLVGGQGNDTLNGGTGVDSMSGGAGDDRYIVDDVSDTITESFGDGTDTVETSLTSFSLSNNLENLEFTSSSDSNGAGTTSDNKLTGNSGNDTLYGDAGSDTLDGGAGQDHMTGGTGNDVYVVDNANDVVNEGAQAGDDTVRSALMDYTLGVGVENLELMGSANSSGSGNLFDNKLIGNDGDNTLNGDNGNDTLEGGAGNDTLNGDAHDDVLDGGTGADSMSGSVGNDTYYVDNVGDTVTEIASGGTDEVRSTIDFVLGADVENLTLLGAANLSGTGNAEANELIGNSGHNALAGAAGADTLDGGAGKDTLTGGTGADSMTGGTGDDTYRVDDSGDVVVEDAGGGDDRVEATASFVLSAHIETLVLLGGAIDGTGNAQANLIIGTGSANTLRGFGSADELRGNGGNDSLFGDAGEDTLVGGAGNDTLNGGTQDDVLRGNDGNDFLVGGAGADTLNGDAGVDTMRGGSGDDTYFVAQSNDRALENAGDGHDVVRSSVDYVLGANVEDLILTGAGNIDGTGNNAANAITGNGRHNELRGEGGNDTLQGSGGKDTIFGGNGNDRMDGGSQNDVLRGEGGNDFLVGDAGSDTLNGDAGVDTMRGGAGNDVYFVDRANDRVVENAGDGHDVVRSSANFLLGANVEDLILIGASNVDGTGNNLANRIIGNGGNNDLAGSGGSDTINGGGGADTLRGDVGADTLNGMLGNDLLFGGAQADRLVGGGGRDTLDGGGGNDVLVGGAANDRLIGGAGVDTAAYVGGSGRYTFTELANGNIRVVDTVGNLGTDILIGVEKVSFGSNVFDIADLL